MPTKKPRVTFAISEDQLMMVEAYQREKRIKNQSQAVLALIEKGLSDFFPERIKEAPPHDEGEDKLVDMYRKLNEQGKERLLDYADDLVSTGKYKKAGSFRVVTKEA